MPKLLAVPGWGSAIVEAAFELTGTAVDREYLDLDRPDERERLKALNPLCQIPTMVLDDGTVMTESAAILLMLADGPNGHVLAPPAGDPQRPMFLRWLIFMVGAIYPTFTYGDDPARYVAGEGVAALRASTDRQREAMFRQVGAAAGSPWFLGSRRSAVDLYVWAMAHWRPGRDWFRRETPRLSAIMDAGDAEPALAEVRQRNGWA